MLLLRDPCLEEDIDDGETWRLMWFLGDVGELDREGDVGDTSGEKMQVGGVTKGWRLVVFVGDDSDSFQA